VKEKIPNTFTLSIVEFLYSYFSIVFTEMQEFFEKHLQYDKNYGRIEVYEIL